MRRRDVVRMGSIALATASLAAPGSARAAAPHYRRLRKGDVVGVVAPASVTYEKIEIDYAGDVLRALGLEPRFGANVSTRFGYLAGEDAARASDINAAFADSLLGWLSESSKLKVKQAKEGDLLTPGTVLLAPPDAHLVISGRGRVSVTPGAPRDGHLPSGSTLLESAAKVYARRAVGVRAVSHLDGRGARPDRGPEGHGDRRP